MACAGCSQHLMPAGLAPNHNCKGTDTQRCWQQKRSLHAAQAKNPSSRCAARRARQCLPPLASRLCVSAARCALVYQSKPTRCQATGGASSATPCSLGAKRPGHGAGGVPADPAACLAGGQRQRRPGSSAANPIRLPGAPDGGRRPATGRPWCCMPAGGRRCACRRLQRRGAGHPCGGSPSARARRAGPRRPSRAADHRSGCRGVAYLYCGGRCALRRGGGPVSFCSRFSCTGRSYAPRRGWCRALWGPAARRPCRVGARPPPRAGGASAWLLCRAAPATHPMRRFLPLVPHPTRRHVLVLDSQGQQLRRLGPLPAPVQHVCWPGADAAVGLLLAATPTGLHCWRDGGATEGCELAPPTGEPPPEQQPAYACIAAALGAPLVAASCTTANEVRGRTLGLLQPVGWAAAAALAAGHAC